MNGIEMILKKQWQTIWAAGALIYLVACQQAPYQVAIETAAEDIVYFEQVVNTLCHPSFEGRDAGSEGIEKAVQYLTAEYRALDLVPAVQTRGVNSYCQTFELPVHVAPKTAELHIGSSDWEAGKDYQWMGLGHDGVFEAPLVDMGYGIQAPEHDYDDYAGLYANSLQGKVVYVERFEPHQEKDAKRSAWGPNGRWTAHGQFLTKVKLAQAYGAAAVLIANTAEGQGLVPHGATKPFGGRDNGVRIPVALLDYEMATQIQAWLEQRAVLSVKGAYEAPSSLATLHNLVAEIPGQGMLADETIVIGAHYDHIGYGDIGSRDPEVRAGKCQLHVGADDNASGVAGVLLVAKALQAEIAAAPQQSRRRVVFALFSGEERGLHGSRHMTKNMPEVGIESVDACYAMLNLDMIGRLREGRLWLYGGEGHDGREPIFGAIGHVHDAWHKPLRLRMDEYRPGGSDDQCFVASGIPAVFFNTGLHPDYHTPQDTVDKLNPEGAVQVSDFAAAVTWRLMTE